ncbi:MAG: hypothetical protein V3R86_03070 [Candidatus Hydrothermarchaeaceae archaeon]
MKRTAKATEKRKELARVVDSKTITYLRKKPASTIYDISKDLGWTIGKVQGSIKRIRGLLVVEKVIENGRLKKKYEFPK